jgi:hypothetical protein
MTENAHPITTHLRHAADAIQLAHHLAQTDTREVTELTETLAALSSLLVRLPDLLTHLHRIIQAADANLYRTTSGVPAEDTLNSAGLALSEAQERFPFLNLAISQVAAEIKDLRVHDPGD